MAALEHPYEGNILINGKKISGYSPRQLARIITYVPQIHGLMLSYTVNEYVMMGRFPYQGFMAIASKDDYDSVSKALELTHTEMFAGRRMNTLSGGELQRVLLAGAVAQHTSILLLDEPATFLDPLHQELTRNALDRIHDSLNSTIITVTHDINDAISRNNNVLALSDGKVYYAGRTEGLSENYFTSLKDIYGLEFTEAIVSSTGQKIYVPAR